MKRVVLIAVFALASCSDAGTDEASPTSISSAPAATVGTTPSAVAQTSTSPTVTVPSTTTASKFPLECGTVGFREASDDVASDIRAEGLSCDDAVTLVRQVRQSHNFVTGPRGFSVDAYRCSVASTDKALPSAVYECESGGVRVSWVKT